MSRLTENDAQGIVAEAQQVINRYLQPGLGAELSTKTYDDTSEKYDDYVKAFGYAGASQAAKTVGEMYPDPKQRETVRILDIAAGSGLVGVDLQKMGFRHMDALDPSQGMLDVAKKRGVYTNFYCNYIDDKQLPIPENSYDGIVIAGGMGENQIPCSALHEMIRLVKPGGYIVNVTRVEHLQNCSDYIGRLDKLMEELEKQGKWKQITRTTFPNILRGKDGLLLVHQVL
ncbi:hypothetical protein BaRGS_00027510 [Batillaria attramentaria]|uniref:Methyltransferase domain-containing protein n=1 Tax=Batillaria attramentaria TaxID=370345 RepID=A0ABD0K1G9_9CAEN|nr:hypothetical protein BaRGS_008078 [Batillaria attramentaria]